MPIVEVPGMGEVEFPDDMSADQIESAIKANMIGSSPQQAGEEAPFMAQMGRGMMEFYQGAKQEFLNLGAKIRPAFDALTQKIDSHVDEMSTPGSAENKAAKILFSSFYEMASEEHVRQVAKDYNAKMSRELREYNANNPDFQIARVLGSLATPLSLVPGAGARTLGGKIASGVVTGTAASQFMPVDTTDNPDEYWAQKGEQALWGAGVGGAIPVAGKLVGVVGDWLGELRKLVSRSDNAVYKDVVKFLHEAFDENRPRIEAAIRRAIENGDDRTVGQILADSSRGAADDFGAKLVRFEQDMAKRSEALRSLYDRQDLVRTEALDYIAGTADDLSSLIARRSANKDRLYKEAFRQKVPVGDPELKRILDLPYAKEALKKAEIAETARGTTSITQLLHSTKLGLDAKLKPSATETALSKSEKDAVKHVKGQLIDWLEKHNPAYKEARLQYLHDSLPIDRMKVAQTIRDSYKNALGNNTPGTYTKAIKEAHKTIKKSGGDPRFNDMSDLFSREELGVFNKIADDLKVDAKAKTMAGRAASSFDEMKAEVEVSLPHILERNVVITNALLKKLAVDKTPQYQKLLSDLMQNPDDFIRAYGGFRGEATKKMALDILRRVTTVTTAQEGGKDLGE